jgi:hydroxylamine reductase (hybrid-cluster protein)
MMPMNVLNVLTNVSTVLTMLITVLNVLLQESTLHLVTAQMVSSITETLVLVVLTTVLLVNLEPNVPLVQLIEKMPQLVNVLMDSSMLVKLNVLLVTGNVPLVMKTTSVLLVLTLLLELSQIVNVHKDSWMLKMDLLNVNKNHIQKDYLT